MPDTPEFRWGRIGKCLCQVSWNCLRPLLLLACLAAVSARVICIGLRLEKPDLGVAEIAFIWVVLALSIVICGSYIFQEKPNFNILLVFSVFLSVALLIISLVALFLPAAHYYDIGEAIQMSKRLDPNIIVKHVCEKFYNMEVNDACQEKIPCDNESFVIFKKENERYHDAPRNDSIDCCVSFDVMSCDKDHIHAIVMKANSSNVAYADEDCEGKINQLEETNRTTILNEGIGYYAFWFSMTIILVLQNCCERRKSNNSASGGARVRGNVGIVRSRNNVA